MDESRRKKGVDEPGPVLVVMPAPSLLNSTLTSPKSAISIANAIRVKIAAKIETNDAITPKIRMLENRVKMNARNVAMVAARILKNYQKEKKKAL